MTGKPRTRLLTEGWTEDEIMRAIACYRIFKEIQAEASRAE